MFSISNYYKVLTSSTFDMWSLIWHHHFHIGPHEWWHVLPKFPPLGPLKMPKLPGTFPSIPPHHADVKCHYSFIGTNHMSPRVLLEEKEKGSPTFYFVMKSFVNPLLAYPIVFNTIRTFWISQLLKGLHFQKFRFFDCWCSNFTMHWTPPGSDIAYSDVVDRQYARTSNMRLPISLML